MTPWHRFPTRFRAPYLPERSGSAVMEAAAEPPPGKEPVMRILRNTVVLVLLGLTLGAPWASAAAARPQKSVQTRPPVQADAVLGVGSFLTSLWQAAGCRIDPWGIFSAGDEGCGLDPLGG